MKESKGRFNILDWLILLVVIAIVGGGYYYMNHRTAAASNSMKHVSYDLEIKAVSNAFSDSVKIGDLIRESTKGNKMGKVTKVDIKPAVMMNPDMVSGKYVNATVSDLYDVLITVDVDAQVSDRSIVTDGLDIKVGKKIFIKGKGYASASTVLAIRLAK